MVGVSGADDPLADGSADRLPGDAPPGRPDEPRPYRTDDAGAEVKRALIVDDDDSLRELLSQVLAEWGFEVKTADDGADALLLLRSERPDVVILDLLMPY